MNTNTAARAIIAAVPTTAPASAAPATVDRRGWNAAVKAKEHAHAAWKAYGPEFDRVHKAWLATRPDMDGIHWKAFWPAPHHPGGRHHIAVKLDLGEHWQQFLDGEGKSWWDHDGARNRMRTALDSVQAYRDAVALHEVESGMATAEEEHDRLTDADCKALHKVMRMPAPDLAALRWKLDYLTTGGTDWDAWEPSYTRQTLADIARLLPPAG